MANLVQTMRLLISILAYAVVDIYLYSRALYAFAKLWAHTGKMYVVMHYATMTGDQRRAQAIQDWLPRVTTYLKWEFRHFEWP